MGVINDKIEEANREIDAVVDLLYQHKEQEALAGINVLLSVLIDLNGLVVEAIRGGADIPFEEQRFNGVLMEAMEAMKAKDTVLLADILQYEVREQIQEWMQE